MDSTMLWIILVLVVVVIVAAIWIVMARRRRNPAPREQVGETTPEVSELERMARLRQAQAEVASAHARRAQAEADLRAGEEHPG